MKKYLLTYSNKGGSPRDRPEALDRTFDSVANAKEHLQEHGYGDEFDYHLWEQRIGFNLKTEVVVTETPPILT